MADVLALPSKLGVKPATVIDVGVASGTPELYRAFPDATLVLVEPLSEFTHARTVALAGRNGVHVGAAGGPRDGRTTIDVHDGDVDGASLFRETMGPPADGSRRPVDMIRIDTIVQREGLASPFVLKIDVQGAELRVLDGSQATLAACELVLLEVSLHQFLRGAPQLGDVVAYMADHGFSVSDVFGGGFRSLDCALGQIDFAFVPTGGSLRTDHRWATTEDDRRAVE